MTSVDDPKRWWWEITVTIRKIFVAAIGVFGSEMGEMQVHVTAYVMVVVIVLTAVIQPFGKKHILLQFLELVTLLATWMTLWAGTVFNTYPRCENGSGGTIEWCDLLSITIGVIDISCVVLFISVIVYYKKEKQCVRFCSNMYEKTIGARRRRKIERKASNRRLRMESKEVSSFENPTLDPEVIENTQELTIEMTTVE